MKKLWLVDVDGTVLDKTKMWEQLESIFRSKFPDVNIRFRAYYDSHKGEAHSVDLAMKAMETEFGIDEASFKGMFDEVDYSQCFDHDGWNRLTERAQKEEIGLSFFTQGSRWAQEAKQRQLTAITGDVPWHIYEGNKMDELKDLMKEYEAKGVKVCGLVDDLSINRMRAESEHRLNSMEKL